MKQSVKKMVECADNAKKVNPLDLSADQDLTIALMNLVAIEDLTQNTQIVSMVRDVREQLMLPMLKRIKSDANSQKNALQLLGQAAKSMADGNRAQDTGDKGAAYRMYDVAYESYVLYLATIYKLGV